MVLLVLEAKWNLFPRLYMKSVKCWTQQHAWEGGHNAFLFTVDKLKYYIQNDT